MDQQPPGRVVVTDVRIPFWSMVTLMVKFAIASIPAMIILAVIGGLLAAVVGGVWQSGSTRTSWSDSPMPPALGARQPAAYPPGFPDRCKGSHEPEKCVELERKLAAGQAK